MTAGDRPDRPLASGARRHPRADVRTAARRRRGRCPRCSHQVDQLAELAARRRSAGRRAARLGRPPGGRRRARAPGTGASVAAQRSGHDDRHGSAAQRAGEGDLPPRLRRGEPATAHRRRRRPARGPALRRRARPSPRAAPARPRRRDGGANNTSSSCATAATSPPTDHFDFLCSSSSCSTSCTPRWERWLRSPVTERTPTSSARPFWSGTAAARYDERLFGGGDPHGGRPSRSRSTTRCWPRPRRGATRVMGLSRRRRCAGRSTRRSRRPSTWPSSPKHARVRLARCSATASMFACPGRSRQAITTSR